VTAKVFDSRGRRVYRARTKVTRGAHTFAWAPRRRGRYTLRMIGLDPARNKASLSRRVRVR
jgi:hypothetical protein